MSLNALTATHATRYTRHIEMFNLGECTAMLKIIEGSGQPKKERSLYSAARAVRDAMKRGCLPGANVSIGHVPGKVIGYNLSAHGLFPGNHYPLLVSTQFGITKASLSELSEIA